MTLSIRYVGKVVHVTFGSEVLPEANCIVVFRKELQFHQKLTRRGGEMEVYHEDRTTVPADKMVVSTPGEYTAILTGRNGHWERAADFTVSN